MAANVAPQQQHTFLSTWSKISIQFKRYGQILRKRWWLLALTISLGLCGGAWFVSQLPPAYLSVGKMMVAGQIHLSESAGYSEDLVNFYGTQVELMQSDEVRQRALARVQALHPELVPDKVSLDVVQMPHASIFKMIGVGQSANFTQAFLDACMDEYVATKKEMRSASSENTTAAIQDELVRLDKEMTAEGEEMLAFQKANNIGFLEKEGNSAGEYLSKLGTQLADLKTEYALLALLDLDENLDRGQAAQNSDSGADSSRAQTEMSAYGPLADYQRAKQDLEVLKAQRADYSKDLRPQHPFIVTLDEKIAQTQTLIEAFRNQSVESLKTRRESIRLQIENIQQTITEWKTKALDLSGRIAEFDKIKEKSERTKNQYDRLLESLRSVDVTKNVDQDAVSILERATGPVSVKPGMPRLMWTGFGLGALVGLILLFIMDKLDDRIGSFMELRSHFPEELLGQIPHEDVPGGDVQLLRPDDPRHSLLESFRTLRSSLMFLPFTGARPKVIMFTSAIPGEGKTTVASNFAVTMAFSGAKTLLVDADLRRGRVADLFKASKEVGLSKVLLQQVAWREAVLDTEIENLHILPRGKIIKHTAEHLLGKITDQFLREIYKEYDYIIIDSAPVLVADDSLCLAPKVDGLILVLRFSQSSARMGRRSLDLLARRQANVIGIVANDIKPSQAEYGYGQYYQYYGHEKEVEAEA
jgi:succinoglycan biosynthesis transport protein ExoP